MPQFVHKRSYLKDQGNPKKRVLLIRYGGIGDHLLAASILPGLKEQGYHVTYNCTPQGFQTLEHDPHIDRFVVQDRDQVPADQLNDYWQAIAKQYDRVINLSESVEGTLLKMPGRRDHALSHEARRMVCDFNYLEFAHAIAGVSGEPKSIFYLSNAEKKWARGFRKKHKKSPIVLWSLGGSSVHKVYPHVEGVTCWLLRNTDAKILFVGSKFEQELEFQVVQVVAKHFLGMTEEEVAKAKLSELLPLLKEHFGRNRILCTCGNWSIREMLVFASQEADVVVGPETGVMHAAGCLEVPKVIFMSHSNRHNLTEYWLNTSALEPVECPCYPCHILHQNWDSCVQVKKPDGEMTGAAMCAWNIAPSRVYKSIIYWLKQQGYEQSIREDLSEMPDGRELSGPDSR